MKFWDSSAIVPLLIEEPNSRACRDLFRADRHRVVWGYTETEVVSALVKQTRLFPPLPQDEVDAALARLDLLGKGWEVVDATTPVAVREVKRHARDHMLVHELRAGDALPLGAATVRFARPMKRDFVVCDGNLADAAAAEGFNVIRLRLKKPPRSR